ncbi:MAG: ABC transporter ATP-binding protein [Verrucomicrobiales bacterium]|nr:ABC transporter ATP-binding protein [Verrucomicrobiales bacterium]
MTIELRAVTKRFGRTRALHKISLEFSSGEIIAILGPNGAGKTTLLRSLAGIVGPDEGEIYFDDRPLRRDDLALRQRFFFLPDFPFLFWDQSVLRNIGIVLRLHGADGSGAEDRALELMRDFDLLPLAASPASSLSRGQAYKTALAALITANPDVWLLDEPLASGMDPLGLSAFKQHARTAASQGRTVIYTSQLLDVAERFSNRICVIHEGEVRAFDTFENLRARSIDQTNVLEQLFRSLRAEST